MTPDEPRQKPYTIGFGDLPISVTIAPEQLQSIGQHEGVVTLKLRNGCRINVGPLSSPQEAVLVVSRVAAASDRARDLRLTPTSKEQYLQALSRNPWTFPYVGSEMGVPPAGWVAEAWELPAVREAIFDGGICRNYLKGLGLAASEEFLAVLSASLRTEQVLRLYEDIREAQPERESEFRDDFLTAFTAHAYALPPAGETTRRVSVRPRSGVTSSWHEVEDEGDIPF